MTEINRSADRESLRIQVALIAFRSLLDGSMEWRARPEEAGPAAVAHADALLAALEKAK